MPPNLDVVSRGDEEKRTLLAEGNKSTNADAEMEHPHHTTKLDRFDHLLHSDEVAFAARLAVVLTVCSMFVLVRFYGPHHNEPFPMGGWVAISALFVSWFPSLDAASVLEKIMQRWLGTIIGAILAFICGMTAISVPILANNPRTYQAVFLAICALIVTFVVVSLAGLIRVGSYHVRRKSQISQPRLIDKYSYACLLCMSTFFICVLPFALDAEPKWKPALMRVINVTIGCLIGALGAMVVCPRSTRRVVAEKTAHQYVLAGEASEAVLLTAAEAFSGRIQPQMLSQGILQGNKSGRKWRILKRMDTSFSQHPGLHFDIDADVALEKYENAISDWKATKLLFPLLQFDPFGVGRDVAVEKVFRANMATTLARALRIQSTIVVLDGMIRNDTECNFSEQQLLMFAEIGRALHRMLTLPLDIQQSDGAASRLFTYLEEIRVGILESSNKLKQNVRSSSTPTILEGGLLDFREKLLKQNMAMSVRMDDDMGRGVPKYVTGADGNSMLFLQLVEHLVVRSLRLYHSWKVADH
jgi:Fusaric acid resistance protein-like